MTHTSQNAAKLGTVQKEDTYTLEAFSVLSTAPQKPGWFRKKASQKEVTRDWQAFKSRQGLMKSPCHTHTSQSVSFEMLACSGRPPASNKPNRSANDSGEGEVQQQPRIQGPEIIYTKAQQ